MERAALFAIATVASRNGFSAIILAVHKSTFSGERFAITARDVIRATIRDAVRAHDVVISSGGVSAGEEDHILDALHAEHAELDILKVAIRPGKPLTVGRLGHSLYFGLPGNPYAAAITFSQIAHPALRHVAGLTEEPDTWIPAVAGFSYTRTTGRREYVPVTWDKRDAVGRPIVKRLGQGASASLTPIARAMGIADEVGGSCSTGIECAKVQLSSTARIGATQ